jgi:uncharacterized protein YceH (UPF0502 family)
LHGLEDLKLAGRARAADGRVTKYEHWLGEAFNFTRAETALVCVLLLRGRQTPGELRGRTERLHRFDELTDVLAGLQKLMEREPALVAVLPRQPGTKESRYTHLLSGNVESAIAAENAFGRREGGLVSGTDSGLDSGLAERVAQLETITVELKQEMAALRQKIDDLFGD